MSWTDDYCVCRVCGRKRGFAARGVDHTACSEQLRIEHSSRKRKKPRPVAIDNLMKDINYNMERNE